jgi:hypothetical protein
MSYTLAEAAQACGVNRSTILRSIKAGKISGQQDESGAWSVEPVELHRVFAPIAAEATPKAVHQDAQTDALVAELRAQLAELRTQRDAWQCIADRLTSALPRPMPEPQPPGEPPQGWWQWRRARRSTG